MKRSLPMMRKSLAMAALIFAAPALAQAPPPEAATGRTEQHASLARHAMVAAANPLAAAAGREMLRRGGNAIDAAVAQAGVLTWTEAGSGPHGQTGTVTAAPMMWGDVIVARKEIPTSYHLAVTLDDAFQGVSDVVRGQDLFWSTSVHRLLQALLGLPEPVYHHHRLILNAEGDKLSKSREAESLRRSIFLPGQRGRTAGGGDMTPA